MALSSSGIVEIDVHGMTKYQARVYIASTIKKAGRSVYRVRVIHGYHRGTELRDMVRREFSGGKILRVEVSLNQGETDLELRELF